MRPVALHHLVWSVLRSWFAAANEGQGSVIFLHMTVLEFLTSILIGLVAVIVGYHVVYRVLRWLIRRRQARAYEKEEMVLLRMIVPKEDERAPTKGPLVMEQIFNTLYGAHKRIGFWSRLLFGRAQPRMSFEIAHLDGQIYFYAYVPKKYRKLMEGQMYAQYPEVEMEVVEDFIARAMKPVEVQEEKSQSPPPRRTKSQKLISQSENKVGHRDLVIGHSEDMGRKDEFQRVTAGQVCVAELGLTDEFIWPFKTYEFFVDKDDKTQVDTLSALTSSMSKLHADADQAWFQLVIRPEEPKWQRIADYLYKDLKKGYFSRWDWSQRKFVNWFYTPYFWHYWLVKAPLRLLLKIFWRMFGLVKEVEAATLVEKQEVGFSYWEIPAKKLSKIGFQTSVRLGYLSRAGDVEGARLKVEEMASSFNQFQWPEVNGLKISTIADTSSTLGKRLFQRMKKRTVEPGMVLGVNELATLYHLPMWNLETPNIAWVRAKKLEPPAELPTPKDIKDLTILGKTNFRGRQKVFGVKTDDRRRHMYIIGKTGMGKSTVLENMIYDDIQKGRGVAVIDPHGELADKVTAMIPKSRINDAVIFDPSDTEHPVSFNMLEVKTPEHRPLVASGLVGVFKKMYADSWGPRLEYILRNCILALTEFEGATLLGIPRLLVDPIYREKVVDRVTDPVVKAFWVDEFANMSDRLRTEAISPIQNKVGQFLSSPTIRNILGQVKSSIDIRFAMDTKKIFVVNLSKGKIGEDNSSLLGAMLITKFQLDAMSRADIDEKERVDFYLYIDEFQNFATDAFATILSEARKYKLNLVMANQYVQQMEEEVMYAVFGNVGTLIAFQVGFDDAEYFSKQFGEVVMPADIISMPKFTTYIRLLVDNMPTKVFSAMMSPPVDVDMESALRRKVLKASRERYGKEKLLVEEKIMKWSKQLAAPEMKKAMLAKGGTSVRWRYDRNKKEFEELLNSAGKKFQELKRDDYGKYDVKEAVNEHVYLIPEDHLLVYSRIDTQGKCFNKKDNKISFYSYDEKDRKKQEVVEELEKGPGWQLGVNKVVGGGFRSPKNKEEMEGVFDKAGFSFQEVNRKDFEDLGLEKALNEVVYRLKKKGKEYVVISALDPQGGCFTRNPEQVIRLGMVGKKGFKEKKSVKKSLEWIGELEKALKKL